MAAVATEQSLIEYELLPAHTSGRDIRARLDDLASDLMTEDAARLPAIRPERDSTS